MVRLCPYAVVHSTDGATFSASVRDLGCARPVCVQGSRARGCLVAADTGGGHSTIKAAYMQLAAHVAMSRRPITSECGTVFGGQLELKLQPSEHGRGRSIRAQVCSPPTPTAQAPHVSQGMRTNDGRCGSCQVLCTMCWCTHARSEHSSVWMISSRGIGLLRRWAEFQVATLQGSSSRLPRASTALHHK